MWPCAERRPDSDCFMAVLSGPQACGRGFQQLPTWLPVGLRNCVRATESAAGSASQVPLPLSPVEGSEPRALVQAGVATGTPGPGSPGPWPCTFCSSRGDNALCAGASFSSLENQSVPNYSSLAARVQLWEVVSSERLHVVLPGLATECGMDGHLTVDADLGLYPAYRQRQILECIASGIGRRVGDPMPGQPTRVP